MRLPKRGEKGFTLIELLIVVAILGVLAAVVIPNVSRFIGAGKEEAADTELDNIQTAVVAMMVDNELVQLPHPVILYTDNMGAFPDSTSDWALVGGKAFDVKGDPYQPSDKEGYLLYQHDRIAGGGTVNLTNYVQQSQTTRRYIVDAYGTVTQELLP